MEEGEKDRDNKRNEKEQRLKRGRRKAFCLGFVLRLCVFVCVCAFLCLCL